MNIPQNLKPNRMVTVGNTVSVPGPTLTPQSGLRIDWPAGGLVLWCAGSPQGVSTNDAFVSGMSSLGFRIQRKGTSEIVTNGSSGDYVQFASVFYLLDQGMPLGVPVGPQEPWFVYFRNVHASSAFTPNFVFAVWEGDISHFGY